MGYVKLRTIFLALLLLGSPHASTAEPSNPDAGHYVAMGSSFASGPGIGEVEATDSGRCMRSPENYARQLARRMRLELTDVSCSGSKIGHILDSWDELPPQINALRSDTRLVTVTVGGNDIAYVGGLIAASCTSQKAIGICAAVLSAAHKQNFSQSELNEENWHNVEEGLLAIATETKKRAPQARLIFVDYLTILPKKQDCGAVPLNKEQIENFRKKASRLAHITRKIAKIANADVIRASKFSAKHHVCAKKPWVTGFSDNVVPYHPNQEGMSAIADAIFRKLKHRNN